MPTRWIVSALLACLASLLSPSLWLPPAGAEPARDTKAARAANARGMKAYRARDWAQAAAAFREAIAADDQMVTARYNLACVASLAADGKTAREQLEWLKASSTEEAQQKLRKGRVDPDLTAVASDPAIRAILDGAAYAPKVPVLVAVQEVTASSSLTAAESDAPWSLLVATQGDGSETESDIRFTRAWCEASPDAGIGQGVTITFAAPVTLGRLGIGAGDWRSAKEFQSRNRILELEVVVDGTQRIVATPPRITKEQTFQQESALPWTEVELPGTPVRTIAVRFTKVKAGRKNDSCITELRLGAVPVVGVGAEAVTALPGALTALVDALASQDRTRLEQAIEFPLRFCTKDDHTQLDCKEQTFRDAAVLRDACSRGKLCPETAQYDVAEVPVSTRGRGGVLVRAARHESWHLKWSGGRWRLQAIVDDYIQY